MRATSCRKDRLCTSLWVKKSRASSSNRTPRVPADRLSVDPPVLVPVPCPPDARAFRPFEDTSPVFLAMLGSHPCSLGVPGAKGY